MCIDNAVFVPYNQVEKGQKPSKGEYENAIVRFKIKKYSHTKFWRLKNLKISKKQL